MNERNACFEGGPLNGQAMKYPKKGKCLQVEGGWYHKTGKKKRDKKGETYYVFRWEPNKIEEGS